MGFFAEDDDGPIDLPEVSLKKLRTLDTKRSFAIIASAFIYGWMTSSNIWRARHLKSLGLNCSLPGSKGMFFAESVQYKINPFHSNLEHEWCRWFLVKRRNLVKSWKGWSKYIQWNTFKTKNMFHYYLQGTNSPAFTGHTWSMFVLQ